MSKDRVIGRVEDLDNLDFRLNGVYKQYCCPYCFDIRGKRDLEYKLYFNTQLGKGYCFKCGSVIHSNHPADMDTLRQMFNQEPPLKKLEKQFLDIAWAKPLSDRHLDYVLHRGISHEYINRFDIRCFNDGIVLSDTIYPNKTTRFFQIRNLTGNIRYTNPRNIIKPVVWIDKVKEGKVIVCEGMFSAISAGQYSGFEPVVILGKSLSNVQLQQFKHHILTHKVNMNEIVCCLDGGYVKENKDLARKLFENFSCNVSIVTLPQNSDPNDLTQSDFSKHFNNRRLFEGF